MRHGSVGDRGMVTKVMHKKTRALLVMISSASDAELRRNLQRQLSSLNYDRGVLWSLCCSKKLPPDAEDNITDELRLARKWSTVDLPKYVH